MFTCVALVLGAVSLAELPMLASEVETQAREIVAQTEVTPNLLAQIEEFSGDAERLSISLREAGVEQDLPCIFHGIAEDARLRAAALEAADTPGERTEAFTELRVLLDDAILIAPMAASAAADEQRVLASND
ncbi:MAG: hypothetical protein AB7O98_07985 [Hyphomonadaceae bacterium]